MRLLTNGAQRELTPVVAGGRREGGEVARHHRRGRDEGYLIERVLSCRRGLQADEEEQFVAHERAAEGPAQLVALEAVLATGQEVRFVETAVAHELEQAAVHRVGAGRHGVHGGAGAE